MTRESGLLFGATLGHELEHGILIINF